MAAGIFGMGGWEILIVAGIILLLFGPTRLPKLAKSLGKSAKALRDGIDGKLEEDEDVETTTAPKAKAQAPVDEDEE